MYHVKQVLMRVSPAKRERRWTIAKGLNGVRKAVPVSFMGCGKLHLKRKVDAINMASWLNRELN